MVSGICELLWLTILLIENGFKPRKRYTDVDWAGNITDRRSTSGYFTFAAGNFLTWRSKMVHSRGRVAGYGVWDLRIIVADDSSHRKWIQITRSYVIVLR